MSKEICKGSSPWKCSVKEANAVFELKRRGVKIIGLMNPLAALEEIKRLEWDALMAEDAPDKKDDVQSSI